MGLDRRLRSTANRVRTHVVHLLSNAMGDDVLSRRLRHRLLTLAGAKLHRTSVVHGGTYVSNPTNLTVGANAGFNRNCYLDLEGPITLEDDAAVGHGVAVLTAAHSLGPSSRRVGPVTPRGVTIQRGAWIGANCVIMPGITIGRGAVVGSGAVVTKDVAPNTFVGGAPAVVIRELEDDAPEPPPSVTITIPAPRPLGRLAQVMSPARRGQWYS